MYGQHAPGSPVEPNSLFNGPHRVFAELFCSLESVEVSDVSFVKAQCP